MPQDDAHEKSGQQPQHSPDPYPHVRWCLGGLKGKVAHQEQYDHHCDYDSQDLPSPAGKVREDFVV
jgi:hypothetical protein